MTIKKHNLGILLNAAQVGEMIGCSGTSVHNYHTLGILPNPADCPQYKNPKWTLQSIEKFIAHGGIEGAKRRQIENMRQAAQETQVLPTQQDVNVGVSLRDYIAVEAMQTLIRVSAEVETGNTIKYFTNQAYWWADAMLQSRAQEQKELPL
jgi:hypothetical protein